MAYRSHSSRLEALIDPHVVERIRANARSGVWDGYTDTADVPYFRRCKFVHMPTGTQGIFTRDIGHHSSGWFKNPDFELCLHLSLSFFDPIARVMLAARDPRLERLWCRLLFGQKHCHLLWCESPYTAHGKELQVMHWRLFCTPGWTPFVPQGEVYSRFKTESGWLSWSDVQAQAAATRRAEHEGRMHE
jgi:hypothetical protein